jgi:outer membrane protein assembly factor BamB
MQTREQRIGGIATGISTLVAVVCLGWWVSVNPAADLVEHHAGMDLPEGISAAAATVEVVQIGELFAAFDREAVDLPGEWSRFRGTRFDNFSHEDLPLADSWSESGPPVLWSVELGEGHAAPAIRNGRVYLLDYDEERKADLLRCFSLADGGELWQRGYRVKVKRNHGLSRTVPAVTDQYVVTIGPRGHVMVVDAITGDFLWGIDLERQYGTTTPFWYTGQCPLIDDGVVVIAPAGSQLLIGVDCASGEVVWQTANPHGWQMSHTSIMPMTIGGKRMYVYSALGGMAGVSAEPEDRGTLLWETTVWNQSVLAASPLALPDGRIFVTAGYGAGAMMLRVNQTSGSYTVEVVQEYKPNQGLASEQQTPLLLDGHLIGIQPKDAGGLRKQLVCYHPDDCTSLVWSSGKTVRFGLGPYIIADDKIFILNDDGTLTLAEASTRGYRQLAQARIIDGVDAWGPLAIAGGRLLLRDATQMVCLDVSAAGVGGA